MPTFQEIMSGLSNQQRPSQVPTVLPSGTVEEDFLPALAFPPSAPINQPAGQQQAPQMTFQQIMESMGGTQQPSGPQSLIRHPEDYQPESDIYKQFGPGNISGALGDILKRSASTAGAPTAGLSPFSKEFLDKNENTGLRFVGAAAGDLSRYLRDFIRTKQADLPHEPVTPYLHPGKDPLSVMTDLEKQYLNTEILGSKTLGELYYDAQATGVGAVEGISSFLGGTAEQLLVPERHDDITPGEVGSELVSGAKHLVTNAVLAGGHRVNRTLSRILGGAGPEDPEYYNIGGPNVFPEGDPAVELIRFATGKDPQQALEDAVHETAGHPEDIYFGLEIGRGVPKQAAALTRGAARFTGVDAYLKEKFGNTTGRTLTDTEILEMSDQRRRTKERGMDQFRQQELNEAFSDAPSLDAAETGQLRGRPDLLREQLRAEEQVSGSELAEQQRTAQEAPQAQRGDALLQQILENERIRQSQQGGRLLSEQLGVEAERVIPEPPAGPAARSADVFSRELQKEERTRQSQKGGKELRGDLRARQKAVEAKKATEDLKADLPVKEKADAVEKLNKSEIEAENYADEFGATYNGVQDLAKGRKGFMFTDDVTGSTVVVRSENFSKDAVKARLEKLRSDFSKPAEPKKTTPEPTLKAEPGEAVEVARLIDSINEGEQILKSGKKISGEKHSPESLESIRKSVESSKLKVEELRKPKVETPTEPAKEIIKPPEQKIASPEDVDFKRAEAAHQHSSFSPEVRAKQRQEDFANTVNQHYDDLSKLAKTEGQKGILDFEIQRFKEGYLKRFNEMLDANSRTASTMITGGSGFNVARNQKRLKTAENRSADLFEFEDKAIKSIKKKLKKQAVEDAGGELAVMKKKLEKAEQLQESMREANKIARTKKLTDVEKIAKLSQLEGISEASAKELLKPDYLSRSGFAGFQLTNNNANIKRMKKRVAEMEAAESRSGVESADMKFEGGEVVINNDIQRIQILFDEKPAPEMITKLKKSGWRWSPREKAWQRKPTVDARRSAERILEIKEVAKEPTPKVEKKLSPSETTTTEMTKEGSTNTSYELTPAGLARLEEMKRMFDSKEKVLRTSGISFESEIGTGYTYVAGPRSTPLYPFWSKEGYNYKSLSSATSKLLDGKKLPAKQWETINEAYKLLDDFIKEDKKSSKQKAAEKDAVAEKAIKDFKEGKGDQDILPFAVAGLAGTAALLGSDEDGRLTTAALFPFLFAGKKKLGKGEITSALKEFKKGNKKSGFDKLKEIYSQVASPKELLPGAKLSVDDVRSIKIAAAKKAGIKLTERADGALIAPRGAGVKLSKFMKEEKQARKLRIAKEAGIAVRLTKTNRPVPNVRKSGVGVPIDFATYPDYKDVKAGVFGGTKDITRMMQEADGGLSAAQKAKLPGGAGPLEQNVLWRTRDLERAKFEWLAEQQEFLDSVFDGVEKADRKILTEVLEKLSRRGAHVDPAKFLNNVRDLTDDIAIVEKAGELRKWYESTLKRQNEARTMRNQDLIPHRKFYSPHEMQKISLWERTFGARLEPKDVMSKPELPDYIKPNEKFNPRAMEREANLPDYLKEMDAARLAENYANTAAADMYNTTIIQNNKAFADQMESMGHANTARAIQDWTAESYAGVKSSLDRAAALHPTVRKGMRWWRRALNRSVFPLNIAWNTVVQTSSAVLTYARYGNIAGVKGLSSWFTDPAFRKDAYNNAYSLIIKSQKAGRISSQDIGAGNVGRLKTKATIGKLDKAVDVANFLTETIETHLTGWSIASAYHHGKSLGLEGKALWEYASDGGAKTQSMYNSADLPGILRSEVVKTAAPFQTFSFELFNTMRELANQTGMSQGTFRNRAGFVTRMVAGAMAVNFTGNALANREPWSARSFVPFYSLLIEPIEMAVTGKDRISSGRGLVAPTGMAVQFGSALSKYFKNGDTTKLRQFLIKYLPGMAGLPAGTQISRTVDGIIAIAEKGQFDHAGRMKFEVTEVQDQIKALLAGPYATEGGKEYIENIGGPSKKENRFNELQKKQDSGEKLTLREKFEMKKISPAAKEEKDTKTKIINLLSFGNEDSARSVFDDWNEDHPDNKIHWERIRVKAAAKKRKRERSGN